MVYMNDGAKFSVKMGGFGRLLTEGNIFKAIVENKAPGRGFVGFTSNFPASIIPINLDAIGGLIKCKLQVTTRHFQQLQLSIIQHSYLP